MKAEFVGPKLELQLRAQSPMIHFQADEAGATLRASDVKPKLDAYILKKIQQEEFDKNKHSVKISDLKKNQAYENLFQNPTSNDNNALAYKMSIVNTGAQKIVKIGQKNAYSIYFGNMGANTKERFGLFSNPLVKIVCTNAKLRRYIEDNICEFFLVSNFGTMSSKGFGSFAPEGFVLDKNSEGELVKALAFYTDTPKGAACYKIKKIYRHGDINQRCISMFDDIKSFYGVMKSGQNFKGYVRSFLFVYMHKNGIDNEKAWIKQHKLATVTCNPKNAKNVDRQDKNPKFVRAFLGMGDSIPWGRETISIKNVNVKDEDKIARIPSPIHFKIIGGTVYIAANRIEKDVFGKTFEFSNKGKRGTISIPKTFDVDDFLKEYVEFFNSKWEKQQNIIEIGEVLRIDV